MVVPARSRGRQSPAPKVYRPENSQAKGPPRTGSLESRRSRASPKEQAPPAPNLSGTKDRGGSAFRPAQHPLRARTTLEPALNNPDNLRYAASHEWVRAEADGTFVIGITDHAQQALGELVYVELPDVGATLTHGEPCGVVESTKAASDVYAPVDGEVVEINAALADAPETVNESAFGDGWLMRVRPADPAQLDALLSAADYEAGLND